MPIFDTPFTYNLGFETPFVSTKQSIPSSIKITHISMDKPCRKGHVTVMVKNGKGKNSSAAVALARLCANDANNTQATSLGCHLDLTVPTRIFLLSEDKEASVVVHGVQYTDLSEQQLNLITQQAQQ